MKNIVIYPSKDISITTTKWVRTIVPVIIKITHRIVYMSALIGETSNEVNDSVAQAIGMGSPELAEAKNDTTENIALEKKQKLKDVVQLYMEHLNHFDISGLSCLEEEMSQSDWAEFNEFAQESYVEKFSDLHGDDAIRSAYVVATCFIEEKALITPSVPCSDDDYVRQAMDVTETAYNLMKSSSLVVLKEAVDCFEVASFSLHSLKSEMPLLELTKHVWSSILAHLEYVSLVSKNPDNAMYVPEVPNALNELQDESVQEAYTHIVKMLTRRFVTQEEMMRQSLSWEAGI